MLLTQTHTNLFSSPSKSDLKGSRQESTLTPGRAGRIPLFNSGVELLRHEMRDFGGFVGRWSLKKQLLPSGSSHETSAPVSCHCLLLSGFHILVGFVSGIFEPGCSQCSGSLIPPSPGANFHSEVKSELFPPNYILLPGGQIQGSPKQELPQSRRGRKSRVGRGKSRKTENPAGLCPHLGLFPFQPRPRGPRHFPEDVPWKEEENWRWAPHDCPPRPPWDDREDFQGSENGFEECWYLVRSAGLGVVAPMGHSG